MESVKDILQLPVKEDRNKKLLPDNTIQCQRLASQCDLAGFDQEFRRVVYHRHIRRAFHVCSHWMGCTVFEENEIKVRLVYVEDVWWKWPDSEQAVLVPQRGCFNSKHNKSQTHSMWCCFDVRSKATNHVKSPQKRQRLYSSRCHHWGFWN